MDVRECDTVGRSLRIDGHLQDPVRDLIFVYESNLKSKLDKKKMELDEKKTFF